MRFFRPSYYLYYNRRIHPLCKFLREIMHIEQTTSLDVADKSGLNSATIRGWFKNSASSPKIENIDAALGVFDYTIVIVPTRWLSKTQRSVTNVKSLKILLARAEAIEDCENITQGAAEIGRKIAVTTL